MQRFKKGNLILMFSVIEQKNTENGSRTYCLVSLIYYIVIALLVIICSIL